jgi:tryptophan synthase alpha chain
MFRLIPYITFSDPNPLFTKKLIYACFDSGVDTVELGLPFSDPIADGPIIQASHARALAENPGLGIEDAFEFCFRIHQEKKKKIIVMVTVTLIYFYGISNFFKSAKKAGISGLVIPDLAIEDAKEYLDCGKKYKVSVNFLVSPDIQFKRLERSVNYTQDFIYLISSVGLTGERTLFSDKLIELSRIIKKIKPVPIYLGFGINTPEQISFANQYMDGAIVGSHFVKLLEQHIDNPDIAIKVVTDRIHTLQQKI